MVYRRLSAVGRFAGRAILNEVQFRLNAMVNHGGFPAYQMVYLCGRMIQWIYF